MAEKIAAPPPVVYQPTERVEDHWPNQTPPVKDKIEVVLEEPSKRPGFFSRHRRALMLLVLIGVFIGGLYGTSVFLRNSGILPAFSNPFAAEIRVAKTDVNLRPEPSPNNEAYGVVTKNSRVRVVKKQGDWYQVDVVEQGREVDPPLAVTRGWLHGRYLELE